VADIKKGDHKLYIGDEQNPKAEITYQEIGENEWNVDHTFVSEELRGEGISGQLVATIVSHAREQGKTITPTCPYAKKKIEGNPEYRDVLAK